MGDGWITYLIVVGIDVKDDGIPDEPHPALPGDAARRAGVVGRVSSLLQFDRDHLGHLSASGIETDERVGGRAGCGLGWCDVGLAIGH
jgi:hypothetical protein